MMQNYNDHVDRADYEELIDYGPLKAATLRVGFLHRILQDRITPLLACCWIRFRRMRKVGS